MVNTEIPKRNLLKTLQPLELYIPRHPQQHLKILEPPPTQAAPAPTTWPNSCSPNSRNPGLPQSQLPFSMIPNTQPLNFLGSYSLVGIGKFNLLFLWIFGGVGCGQPCSKIMSKGPTKIGYPNELQWGL